MAKIYTIEVIKESRALLTGIEAESNAEAQDKAKEMAAKGEVQWTMTDNITTEIVNAREKKN